jgi:methylisocitrate lyase
MNMYEKRVRLKELIAAPECVPVMGAYDVLSAKLIENTGFPIVYTGSFITGASQFFLADVGLVQLKDLLPLAYEIAKEVDLPLICDADNGWFHSGNIWRTVHEFEAAGVSGIQVEDGIIRPHRPVQRGDGGPHPRHVRGAGGQKFCHHRPHRCPVAEKRLG